MRQRFNKWERKENRQYKLEHSMSGSGLYVYENNTDGDLTLPRPTASGQTKVGPRQRFQGDDYYMQWVKYPLNLLRFVEQLQPNNKEKEIMEKKLILDQPEMITERGAIEHVAVEPQVPVQRLNDSAAPQPQAQPVLRIQRSAPLSARWTRRVASKWGGRTLAATPSIIALSLASSELVSSC